MSLYFPDWQKEKEKLREIHDYRYIIRRFPNIDEANMNVPDENDRHNPKRSFCERCNGFFRNNRKYASQSVSQEHYKLLIKYKNNALVPDFKTALQNIFDNTGVINPKLASQALHFLNHDLPIYSKPILEQLLNINVRPRITESNINQFCEIYERLKKEVNGLRVSAKGQDIIKDFKHSFNNDNHIIDYISDNKIIDFYFWLPTLDE